MDISLSQDTVADHHSDANPDLTAANSIVGTMLMDSASRLHSTHHKTHRQQHDGSQDTRSERDVVVLEVTIALEFIEECLQSEETLAFMAAMQVAALLQREDLREKVSAPRTSS